MNVLGYFILLTLPLITLITISTLITVAFTLTYLTCCSCHKLIHYDCVHCASATVNVKYKKEKNILKNHIDSSNHSLGLTIFHLY